MAGTVLIIDDDPITREGLRSILEKEGYPVAVAGDGADALSYLNGNPIPCLILLDMMMPTVDGWKFLSTVQQNPIWTDIPVIISTAMGVASPEWAASLGAVALLKKPFDAAELLQPVRRYC